MTDKINLTRTRLERIILLDQELRANHYPNCSSFAKKVAARFGYEKPVNRRTILRDIDWLRDICRAPLEWSDCNRGYYYTDTNWQLPTGVSLTQLELLHLLMAGYMAEAYKETPLADSLVGLFNKLNLVLAENVNIDPMFLHRKISFHRPISSEVRPELWNTLFTALRQEHSLDIVYNGVQRDEEPKRRIDPIHLANVDGEWYLIAYCHKRGARRHFSVGRIESARDTGEAFSFPDDFDTESYFSNRFGYFIGRPDEKPHKVIVRFTADMAPWVLSRIWHEKQAIKHHKNGDFTITIPIPSLNEAKRWVQSWGKKAVVLAPRRLRDMID